MTRHFTYEIDERKLRVKLKDLEVPLSETAWEQFEAFSNRQNKSNSESPFSGLKISLNRNIVLLTVFAAVIVSFSLLLFNFISIKNPKKENTQPLAEVKTETAAEPVKPAASVTPSVTLQQKEKEAIGTNGGITSTVTVAKQLETSPVLEKPAVKPVAIEELNGEELELLRQKNEEIRKRKEQKAAAALVNQIKPTAVTEDTEPDVKPQ